MTLEKTIKIPDIGGASGVDVIEILVKAGDKIEVDTPLVTLESDKASMEIPSSDEGVVKSIHIAVGDKVAEGDVILTLECATTIDAPEHVPENTSGDVSDAKVADVDKPSETSPQTLANPKETVASKVPASQLNHTKEHSVVDNHGETIYAGPAVRRLSHTLGVDLRQVQGSGLKSRITKEDVEQYVKKKLSTSSGASLTFEQGPSIDFSKFGEITVKPLNKIKRLTGVNVHRAWVTIPHVTQFDEADITDLEAFRKEEITRGTQDAPVKLTILAFVCKVVSKALAAFPQFNASLDASGENLIYKQYCHIGIAVETPNGLVVPVLKDVNQLSVTDIATEMARLSRKAREKGLMPADMSGGCFTISSLGGIGGTAFTPIVNSPEVAILGLSRSQHKPVYQEGNFVPRLMLPLSLSYDHRVIDGAEAARFTRFLSEHLADIRRILL